MYPYHLVNMTPEQERFLRGLLDKHHARWEHPIQYEKTDRGVCARRLELIGFGPTEHEAAQDLGSKELDALLAEVPIKKKPE